MKRSKIMAIIYLILGIFVLVLVAALFVPKEYTIKREIIIDRPIEVVYEHLRFFKNHTSFNTWYLKDPGMKAASKGTDGQVGYILAYEGNKDLGSGEQELVGLSPNERVDIEVRFLKPFKSTARTPFLLENRGDDRTNVVWEMQGKMKYPMNLMLLFNAMDTFLGPDIQKSLENLKSILENQ